MVKLGSLIVQYKVILNDTLTALRKIIFYSTTSGLKMLKGAL